MSQSFQEVVARWKAEKRQWVKESSYATYVRLINAHLLPFFSGKQPIDEPLIQLYANEKLASGLSVKTIRDSLTVLKMILRYGEKTGAWPHTEFEVRFPTTTEKPDSLQILSRPQQQSLLQHLQVHFSFRNLGILICLHTGLRIGEVCGLQWRDVDISAGIIHVRRTVQRIWLTDGPETINALSVGTPKTASSVRDIPICKALLQTLRPLAKVMRPDHYIVSNAAAPMEPRYFRAYFRKLLTRLDIPPVRFHALRHSFATRCIESRCDYKTVSALLGHSSISTTLNLYDHPDLAAKRRAIEQMARGMGRW